MHKVLLLPKYDYYATVNVEKYKGESWFCTETEAQKAGFTRSPNCKYTRK